MKKRLSYLLIFDTNPLLLFCVFFTISIMTAAFSVAIAESQNVDFVRVVIFNAAYCLAPVIPLIVLNRGAIGKKLDAAEHGLLIGLITHFITSCALNIFFTWIIIQIFTIGEGISYWAVIRGGLGGYIRIYILISIGAIIIDFYNTARANRSLRAIQNRREQENEKDN